ncbi:MAG TPA: nucleotidyl transferase AbiEii/AbiGii toxin family protein [Armatimonadota bacterium]
MTHSTPDLAASIRQRLLNLSKKRNEDFQTTLTRYGGERLLYRLSQSAHRDAFVLKGATLLLQWTGDAYRATRDLDPLGWGSESPDHLVEVFREVVGVCVEPDGLVFAPNLVSGKEIREDAVYGGVRVRLTATLGAARIPLQVDVGFGDAITPGAVEIELPAALGLPSPRLHAYTPETVVAEKFQAMVALGMANSRMKDLADVWELSRRIGFKGSTLAAAVTATFARRQTPVPASGDPMPFTPAFFDDEGKRRQWKALVARGVSIHGTPTLSDTCLALRDFLMPIARAAAGAQTFDAVWRPGGPWTWLAGPPVAGIA